ncbi:uncharacterized protein LOC119168632 [Rhipicephalus microplus]|uniref:uncharacterized protein LOC119168632 n=1 Tax=Rhipicephalus microplus TaxID=6941 RepID=UPI003F6D32C2
MPATLNGAAATLFLLASLTACYCKGAQEQSLLGKVELADTDNATTAGVDRAVTTPEPRNDTRIEVTSQASSLRDGGTSGVTSLSSGWDTAYKLLYETFSYPEAKELEALLPLPSTYLTRKQRRDRKGDHGEPRKKEQQRQHAARELTYRTVSSDEGSGGHAIDHKDDAYDEGGDPGSSESSSQSEEEEAVGRVFGDPLEDDNDDEAEMSDDDSDEVVKQKTSSSTPSPSPSRAHRRTERSLPVTGTLLPPPRRPWKEHGKDFGLLVPEDRWSKHVAAKRREAQLIRRNLQDQLRMKALQWRQKENHFHQRYKPAIPAGTI